MLRQRVFCFLVVLGVFSPMVSSAITVQPVPNPAQFGQAVTFTISWIYTPLAACPSLQVNFGDSTGTTAPCTFSTNVGGGVLCQTMVPHVYGNAGNFTATAGSGGCANPPDPASASLTVLCAPLAVTTAATLPPGTAGQPYSRQIVSSGGQAPVSFSVVAGSLPPGLTLSPGGLLGGTPATPGTYGFTVRATDSCTVGAAAGAPLGGPQTADRAFTVTIGAAPCPALNMVTPAGLPGGTVGQMYSQTIVAGGGQPPLSFSVLAGTLPPGLSLAANGLVSGVPAGAGTYTFTVRATDSCPGVPAGGPQTAERAFTVVIASAPPSCPPLSMISAGTLPGAVAGQAYSQQLRATGGRAPVGYSIVAGGLPPGLSLGGTGFISGVPGTPGTYTFTVRATDSCTGTGGPSPQSSDGTFSLSVAAQPPPPPGCPRLSLTTPSPLPEGTVGQQYGQQIVAVGGQPPLRFSLVSGALPRGLGLGVTGFLGGTPSAAGTSTFTVRATDGCSPAQNEDKLFVLNVARAPVALSATPVPPSLSIPRNAAAVRQLTYGFFTAPPVSTVLSSPQGRFMAGGESIGTSEGALAVSVVNGRGAASEILNIPAAIARRAAERGLARVTYVRLFSGDGLSVRVEVQLLVTTEAAADFSIDRMRISFGDAGSQTTVRRQAVLRARAEIGYTGLGFLQGFWDVDGRVLATEHRHLPAARSVVIDSPEIPALPTFEPGTHRVRFVITDPMVGFDMPEAIYFVEEAVDEKAFPIDLRMPLDGADVAFRPVVFHWGGAEGLTTYLIEIWAQEGEPPVFGAYATTPEYLIPEQVFSGAFAPGRTYRWRVSGFDPQGEKVSQSPAFTFTFEGTAPQ